MKDIYKAPYTPKVHWRKSVRPDGRIIWAPNEAIVGEQRHMLDELQSLGVPVGNFVHATGSLKGSNILKNAQCHAHNRYFLTLDISNAYGQVQMAILADKLAALGLAPTAEEVYERLSRYYVPPTGDGLAMGGPASPMLFNFYCMDMDLQLGAFCEVNGIAYTRYLDDLTFSSPDTGSYRHDVIGTSKTMAIREFIAKNELALNEQKTRRMDLANGPVRITGVQINPGGKIQLKTSYMRAAKRELQQRLTSVAEIDEVVQYAAGLKGYFNVVQGSRHSMSKDEKALYNIIQDILMSYGNPFKNT